MRKLSLFLQPPLMAVLPPQMAMPSIWAIFPCGFRSLAAHSRIAQLFPSVRTSSSIQMGHRELGHSSKSDGGKHRGEGQYGIAHLNHERIGSGGRRATTGCSDLNDRHLNDEKPALTWELFTRKFLILVYHRS
jgi:hypothetical protein